MKLIIISLFVLSIGFGSAAFGSVQFDGSTDYYTYADQDYYSAFENGGGTFSAWVLSDASCCLNQHMWSKGGSSNWEHFMQIPYTNPDTRVAVEFYTLAGGGHASLTDNPTPSPIDGAWHQQIAHLDHGIRLEYWEDGVEQDTDTSIGSDMGNGNKPLSQGRRNDNNCCYFEGQFSYMVFWSSQLTDNQMVAMFNGVNPFAIDPDSQTLFAMYFDAGHVSDFANQNNPIESGTPVKGTTNPRMELLGENYL